MKESWYPVAPQTTLRTAGLTVKSYITTVTVATTAAPIAMVSTMTTGRNLEDKLSQCRLLLGLEFLQGEASSGNQGGAQAACLVYLS